MKAFFEGLGFTKKNDSNPRVSLWILINFLDSCSI